MAFCVPWISSSTRNTRSRGAIKASPSTVTVIECLVTDVVHFIAHSRSGQVRLRALSERAPLPSVEDSCGSLHMSCRSSRSTRELPE